MRHPTKEIESHRPPIFSTLAPYPNVSPFFLGPSTDQSSEMNVAFPKPGTADFEMMEMPIPEQFVHTVKMDPKPHITSEVSDLYC